MKFLKRTIIFNLKNFKMSKVESKVPRIKLSSGYSIPVIGLGTFKTEKEPEKLSNAVKEAIKQGYRHIDCAYAYENEDVIGKAIHEAMEEFNVTREELFITTKVWNTFHSKEGVMQCFNKQIKDLGTDYIDLYLIHWPMGYKENTGEIFPADDKGQAIDSGVHYLETYKAMEELLAQGKIKSIGVSNFNQSQLEDVMKNCKKKPVVNQIEIHPYHQNDEMINFCHKNDINVIAYAPLGASDRGWLKPEDPVVLKDEVINKLAQKYNKSAGQICIKWALQRNLIVIPKSVTPTRIKDNIDVFDFALSEEDMMGINKLNKGFRYYGCPEAITHKLHPFK